MIPLFEVATLFVDMCQAVTDESIIGRAQRAGKIQVRYWNIRDYAGNKHNRVDDCTYGGGRGMLMQAAPIYRCWQAVCQASGERPYVVFPSPQGKVFTQQKAVELSRRPRLLFLCGHYEGVDQRVLDEIVDEELSLGDFVPTGGEIAAMAVADAVCRLVPGVLSDAACFQEESHWDGLLEYPQYSRPEVWHGRAVPPELLTGDHAKVERWRRKQSLLRTRERRPELYGNLDLSSKADQKLLAELEQDLTRPVLPQPVECRPARQDDLDAMLVIAAQAQAFLASCKVDQWQDGYPERRHFQVDLDRGECFVLTCEGTLGAFFVLSSRPEPSYNSISDGKWSREEPYAVLHRCAVAEQWRGAGLADRMIAECGQLALSQGLGWLRVDTHKKNKAMQGLLRRNGFQYRGNITVTVNGGHDPRRVAYEKRLKPL